MIAIPATSILHHFATIQDPRVDRQKNHQLQDIFFITLCAVICGADNWVAIEEFGHSKEEWFTDLLGLQYGIPSHDTLGDVFAAIDAEQFSQCFSNWVADLANMTNGEVIAIDGKCVRRSLDKASNKAAIHRQLVLGHGRMVWFWARLNWMRNPTKLPPFPNLLSRLDINGACRSLRSERLARSALKPLDRCQVRQFQTRMLRPIRYREQIGVRRGEMIAGQILLTIQLSGEPIVFPAQDAPEHHIGVIRQSIAEQGGERFVQFRGNIVQPLEHPVTGQTAVAGYEILTARKLGDVLQRATCRRISARYSP
ncbi:MAG: ISAs1 family transposase [Methylococcaceae bacterium]|nr:ISAs1 family transposase [Methylococcaceae bacterium]